MQSFIHNCNLLFFNTQEQNLKAKGRDEEESRQLLLAKQATALNTASAKKEVKIHQDSMVRPDVLFILKIAPLILSFGVY